MPELVPKTKEVVPAGLIQVVLDATLIPIFSAYNLLVARTKLAAYSKPQPLTALDAIPVIDTPSRASFSVVCFHISLR